MDGNGKTSIDAVRAAGREQVVEPAAAYIMTDILAGNTNPKKNPFWGQFAVMDGAKRRPATLKTGTSNDARDLNAYGYIGPPTARAASPASTRSRSAPGTATPTTRSSAPAAPLFSIDVTTYVWQGFLEEATRVVDQRFGGPTA